MRLALGAVRQVEDRVLRFAAQLGMEGVVINTPLDVPGDGSWDAQALGRVRERVEKHGLKIEAIENTPIGFYRDAILGLPARDDVIARYCSTVRAVGAAGIPILGFHWMANEVWRSSRDASGRGGARVTAFDLSLIPDADSPTHGRVFGEDEIWDNFSYFLERVLPVAEESGVRLALHPDDPPLPSMGGIARIFRSQEGLQRAIDLAASEAFQLDFCLGTISEIGPGAIATMAHFAGQRKIAYVHFRDVRGHVPVFEECFLDEGNVDVVDALRALRDTGFDGFIIDDHVPLLDGDPAIADEWVESQYAYLGRAYANGYLGGLLRAVMAEPAVTR